MGAHALLLYHACLPFPAKLHTTTYYRVCAYCVCYYVHICQEAILKMCLFYTSPHIQSSHMYGLHCLLVSVADIFARWWVQSIASMKCWF